MGLAARQVAIDRQTVRTWSNTHRAGAPLLGKSPADQTAASAPPKNIDVLNTSVALRDVRQPEAVAPQLLSAPQLTAPPQPATATAVFREPWTGIGPSMPATDLPSPNRRNEFGVEEGQTEAHRQAQTALFREEGEFWEILYEGTRVRIQSLKGLFYLRHLLQNPGAKIHVSSLTALGEHCASMARRSGRSADRGLAVPPKAPLLVNDAGPVIDARATWEYRGRLDELRSELEEASQWADLERAASIQREIELINGELASAYGLNGRRRRLDDQIERMRKAVKNRIHDAIVRIAKQNPVLGRHLTNTIRTGLLCRYSPENDVPWEF
jgi:hypothetical protein